MDSLSNCKIIIDFLTLCLQCRLLITFENILVADQARQNVGPDLDPNCLTLSCYSRKNFSKKFIVKKKISRGQKSMQNYPVGKGLVMDQLM